MIFLHVEIVNIDLLPVIPLMAIQIQCNIITAPTLAQLLLALGCLVLLGLLVLPVFLGILGLMALCWIRDPPVSVILLKALFW